MKLYVIRIIALADGRRSKHDDRFLSYYDPTKHGTRGDIRSTHDVRKAMHFPSGAEAIKLFQLSHGTRPDGRPNRPLTAFAVSVEPLE